MSIGVGVIGLGFMGQTHVRAYTSAGAQLVAVLDSSEQRRSGQLEASGNLGEQTSERLFDPKTVHTTEDLSAFLSTPNLELVSICTPTDTHIELATAALRAGKHVLVEKPVALSVDAVKALRNEAARSGRLCMPAMCMRYWPAWDWTKQAIDDERYGAVTSMRLERLGSRPTWGAGFYADEFRSGGALFDLHVHDSDFVVHCLGMPQQVLTVGDTRHMTSLYMFEDGPKQIVARGGWLNSPASPFTMRMLVEFERAVAIFDLGRTPEFAVHTGEGETITPVLETYHGWEGEIRAMVQAVALRDARPPTTLDDALAVTRVLEAERESLRTHAIVRIRHD